MNTKMHSISVGVLAALLAGCGDDGVSVVGRETLNCYKFTARNNTDRPVTDIHFPFEATPLLPSAPGAWEGHPAKGGGVDFETPPPRPDDETQPRPQPIEPGGEFGPFVFYVRKAAGVKEIPVGRAEFSHPEGPNSPIQTQPADKIKPDSTLNCTEIKIAPKGGKKATTIELSSGGSSAGFVGIGGLDGGASSIVDKGKSITIFRTGGRPMSLPVTVKVYHRRRVKVNWKVRSGDSQVGSGSVHL